MTRNATARLFVAVELPATVREQLNGWARAALSGLSSRTRIRVLDMELLHVTLCFLGSRPVAEVEPIAAQLSACDGCASELSLGAPLWLPRRRPRALAVEVHDEDGALADLQRAVAGAMGEVGARGLVNNAGSTGDAHSRRRRFHPHVTVARMPGGAAPRERALSATPCVSFIPSELVLYRSWLSPDGASYEAIASHVIG